MVNVSVSSLGYEGPNGYLLFRDDTAVFATGNAGATFVHGGNSPQERVIPVLVVKRRHAPGPIASKYVVEGVVGKPVLGAQRVQLRVQLGKEATGSLGFTGARSVQVSLRALDRPDVSLRIREASGPGKLRGTELDVPVGPEWTEVFFVLEAPGEDARVKLEAFPASLADAVASHVFTDFFDVAGTALRPEAASTPAEARRRSEPPPAETTSSWKDQIEDPDFRRAFEHIAEHGQLSEQELSTMITARKARAFTRHYDAMIAKLPFRVRIEVAGGQKVYLKDGGR